MKTLSKILVILAIPFSLFCDTGVNPVETTTMAPTTVPPTTQTSTLTTLGPTTTFQATIYGDSLTDLWDTAIAPEGTVNIDIYGDSTDAFTGENHGTDGVSIQVHWDDAAAQWQSYAQVNLYATDTDWSTKTLSFWAKATLDSKATAYGGYPILLLVDDAVGWQGPGIGTCANALEGCNETVSQYGGAGYLITTLWQKFTINFASASPANAYNSTMFVDLTKVRNIQFVTALGGDVLINTDTMNTLYFDDIDVR